MSSNLNRYTAFIVWPSTPPDTVDEEIDVDAVDIISARAQVLELLKKEYRPGGRILCMERRYGLYM